MIRSFGLHWQAENVFWGWQSVNGTLMGAASRSSRARQVNFREQRGIYALYADYELVYLGQTGGKDRDRLFNRLRTHRRDHLSERWNRFSWFGTQRVNKTNTLAVEAEKVSQETQAALNIMEAVAIAISEPRLNLQRGRWGDATQYYQALDPDLAKARARAAAKEEVLDE
jgi:hypothetical protein